MNGRRIVDRIAADRDERHAELEASIADALPPLHALKAEGQTWCGLTGVTEGLPPNKTQYVTCEDCKAALMRFGGT